MKKIVMLLAIAACAIQVQAETKIRYLWYQQAYDASTGASREFTAADKTAVENGYYSFYSVSADKIKSVTGMDLPYAANKYPDAKYSVSKLVNWLGDEENRSTWQEKASYTWTTGSTTLDTKDKAIKMQVTAWNNDSIRWTVAFYKDNDGHEAFAVTLTGFTVEGQPTNWDPSASVKRGSEQLKTSEKNPEGLYYHGTTAWQTVPEPTSGLLLLLGVAGLALKRKRA